MGNQEEQAIEGCAQPPSKTAVSEEDIPSEDVEACLLTQSLRLSVTQISLAAHLQQIENMAMRGRHEKEASSEQALLYVEEMKERYESMRATREAELRHISVFAACLYNLFLPEKKSAEEGCSSSSSSTLMVDKKNDPRHKLAVHAVLEGMQALQLASAEEDLEAAKLLSAAVDRGLQCIRFYSDNKSNDQEKVLGRKEVHDLLSIYIHLLCLHPAEVLPWAASPTLLLLTFFSSSSDDNNEVSLEKLRLRLLIAVLPLTLTSSSALLASSLAVASLAQTPVCFSMWQQSTSKFTPVLMERLHSLLNSSFESGSCDYTYWPDPVTMHRKAYFIIPKPSSHKYKELIAVLDVVKAILIIGDESLFIQTIHVLRSSSLLVAYRNAIIAQPLEKTSVYMAYDAETTIAGAGLPSVWNKCMEIVVLVLSYQTFSFSAPAFVALTEALHLFMFHYHPLLRVILKPPTAGGVVSLASLDQKAQVIQLLYRLRTLPMRNSVLPPALDQEFIRCVVIYWWFLLTDVIFYAIIQICVCHSCSLCPLFAAPSCH